VQFQDRASAELTPALEQAVADAAVGGVRLHRDAFRLAHELARREV